MSRFKLLDRLRGSVLAGSVGTSESEDKLLSSLRAQRLTGRATALSRAEARSAVRGRGVPGGSHVRPTRTTETGPRDDRPHTGATSLQTCLVFSAPRPRPSKSPGIHRKNSGPPPSDPGVRGSAGLGGGGGSLERTRLARRQANKRRILDGSLLCPASNSLTGLRGECLGGQRRYLRIGG